ncbi:DsbA family protein [Candidatus Woesearchaeota archaeon]|nr:DsbA family protein [Candidatus Woesearchaeota archaeon]
MNKTTIILLCMSTIIFLACENIDLDQVSDEDLERIANKAIVCEKPYMRLGAGCCLDQDDNSICDKDESVIPPDQPEEVSPPVVNPTEPDPMPEEVVPYPESDEVIFIEYSDFECPFCISFYTDTLPQIKEKYVETGDIKYIYKHFPLSFHPSAQKAAEATECARDQGKFWEMHDALFEKGVSDGVVSFKEYASDLDLDREEFDSCLDSGEKASIIQKHIAEGQLAGVRGTPAFFINGRLISGAQPFENFDRELTAALEAD